VAGLVAFEDAASLPVLYLVEELMARDAYFAYEQLIKVVGG
jgi:hypothetical protein